MILTRTTNPGTTLVPEGMMLMALTTSPCSVKAHSNAMSLIETPTYEGVFVCVRGWYSSNYTNYSCYSTSWYFNFITSKQIIENDQS